MSSVRMVAVMCLVLLLVGCSSARPSEHEAVRKTILRYNDLLAQGYRSLDMNPMQEVATKLQAEAEYIHMSSLAEGGVRLDPELRHIEFVKVSVEATSASVETRERWDYRHYARADGKLALEQTGLVYVLAWDLERQADGRWLVSDVRAISSTTTVEPKVLGTITPVPSQNP
jgi:hypothetical protein